MNIKFWMLSIALFAVPAASGCCGWNSCCNPGYGGGGAYYPPPNACCQPATSYCAPATYAAPVQMPVTAQPTLQ